jgi:flagellar assembly protein FliH
LSRRLPGNRLHAEDVRLMPLPGSERSTIRQQASCDSELESLDLVNLGPYLLLLQAQEKAEELISSARAEADKIHQHSRLNGAAQGRGEAKQEALPAAMAFANVGQSLIVLEEQMIARYTPSMVQLALEIAEKVVHKAVAAEPEIVAAVLERARQEVSEARRVCVRLNPKDHELLGEIRPDLLTLGNDAGRVIEVVPDEDVTRGGCRIETDIGVIDATLPTQLGELRRQLLDQESLAVSANAMANSQANAVMSREL